jgi:biopolymer transport protein ExbD
MQINPPRYRTLRLNLTPLIDVVFLLLVFFMVTSTFVKYTGLDMSSGRSGVVTTQIRDLVIIRVHGEGRIDINGRPFKLDDVTNELVALAGDRKLKVAIKPDEKTNLQDVVDVIERARIDQVQDVLVVR